MEQLGFQVRIRPKIAVPIIKDKRKNYVGKEITIHDNRKICSHAAECVNNLPSVFKFNVRPWINPDAADKQQIINKIKTSAVQYIIEYMTQIMNRPPPGERPNNNNPSTLNVIQKQRMEMLTYFVFLPKTSNFTGSKSEENINKNTKNPLFILSILFLEQINLCES